MPRTSFYIRGPKIGPIHTVYHLGSIGGSGSSHHRTTPKGPVWHGRVTSPNGQHVYLCEHSHHTETAALKCAGTPATRELAAAAFRQAAQAAAAQASAAQAKTAAAAAKAQARTARRDTKAQARAAKRDARSG